MRRALVALAGSAAALALVIPLAATAHHKPGHEGGDTTGLLTIDAAPNPVLWGASTTISGRLRGPENNGRTIDLQHDPHPYGTDYNPTPLARTTTNGDGYYTFTVAPGRNTNYRVVARVDPERFSENVKVGVRMNITRRVSDRTPRRGQRVTFSGRVTPAHDDRVVRIQRLGSDGVFRTVARTRTEDAGEDSPRRSVYERRLRIFRDGVFRAQISGDDDHRGNASSPVQLDVP